MHGPVAIGGVGGSGTRIVAEIIKQLGFYIGSDLNSANDNLWFTLLLKRPHWFLKNKDNPEEIFQYLDVFERIMKGENLSSRDYLLIIKAAFDISLHGHNVSGTGRGLWPFKRIFTILTNKSYDMASFKGYGWKEPNTHILLPYLEKHFKSMSYIHVIRNGLDMAFSSNQNQLFNWGQVYGITPDGAQPLPKLSLEFWIRANKEAVNYGREILRDRFFLVNFDNLCLNPEIEIKRIINFLGISENVNMDRLVSLPRVPESMGRYKKHDLSIFSKEQIKAVEEFGFKII